MNWVIPIGLGVVAAAIVLAAQEQKDKSIIDATTIKSLRKPINASPFIRYSGPFVQLSPQPQSGSAPKQGHY